MAGYVYVLHFDTPLSHAEHYIGCTKDLFGRLERHAKGYGARIMKAVNEAEIEWRLGALGTTTDACLRSIEKAAKDRHNAKRFCSICNGESADRMRGTTPYDLGSIPGISSSRALREIGSRFGDITYGISCEVDMPSIEGGIRELMNNNRTELGYIPFSEDSGIYRAGRLGQIYYARMGVKVVGFIMFSKNDKEVRIHQCVVEDAMRGEGIGSVLLSQVCTMARALERSVSASVREDLPANNFWTKNGFFVLHSVKHPTSGNILNCYRLAK